MDNSSLNFPQRNVDLKTKELEATQKAVQVQLYVMEAYQCLLLEQKLGTDRRR